MNHDFGEPTIILFHSISLIFEEMFTDKYNINIPIVRNSKKYFFYFFLSKNTNIYVYTIGVVATRSKNRLLCIIQYTYIIEFLIKCVPL